MSLDIISRKNILHKQIYVSYAKDDNTREVNLMMLPEVKTTYPLTDFLHCYFLLHNQNSFDAKCCV